MKPIQRISLVLFLMLTLLALPSPVYAQGPDNGQFVFGGSYELKDGQTLNGPLVIFGGQASLEQGSTVDNDVIVTGGTMDADGVINGDITAIGGVVRLGENAVVNGDIHSMGATISRAEGSVVQGDILSEEPNNLDNNLLPDVLPGIQIPNRAVIPSFFQDIFSSLSGLLWAVLRALAAAALAAIVVVFLQTPTERVARAITSAPLVSGGMGLLTILVAPALFVLLIITIILIPVGLIGILLLAIALLYGWVALGLELGQRLSTQLHQAWAAPVSAGIGTLLLVLLSSAVAWIPCVGWVVPVIISIVGLGGVIMSRGGIMPYSGSGTVGVAYTPPPSSPPVHTSAPQPQEPPAALTPQAAPAEDVILDPGQEDQPSANES
ncbi:MAG: polymer-forming cytoskeletal protein [Chloroflexi bacterium]|nr:polymer-forming cytoskeletal protein [Chloroflexota bacterium]